MHQPRHVALAALLALALAGLLALPMRLQAASTNVYLNPIMAVGKPCVILPPKGRRPTATATPKNPKLCTPTPATTATARPTTTPTSTTTATSTPLNTATPTSPATATNTPLDTATPTDTPTSAPTSTATPTSTVTPTSTATPAPPANITVYNTGAFFAQYYVSYNLPNLPLQTLYSGVFNINQGVTLTIPGNATNVSVLIQAYTGITGWQTACTRAYAQATTAVIIVSGTPFLANCAGG